MRRAEPAPAPRKFCPLPSPRRAAAVTSIHRCYRRATQSSPR
jgi:hypothetical protein